ncbi:MAG: nucleotide sugar dehydrogenase [Candidatus Dormibacteraceae bacterium]
MIGAGYVGLTSGACLADLGNDVTVVEIDEVKVRALRRARLHFYEPGLKELVERNVRAGRLVFTTNYAEAIPDADFAFVAVGTPEGEDGSADLHYVEAAASEVAQHLTGPLVVINKSTVPIGTGDVVSEVFQRTNPQFPVSVVSNPEFLREGSAVGDFMRPDRVVIGAHDKAAAEKVGRLYASLGAPVLIYGIYTAEMVKYASNAFLATRISFMNEIARICERVDADAKLVAEGMGLDKRIGRQFLDAGIGYGGSCLVGEETVLARRGGRVQLLSLEQLYAEFDETDACEVLSWQRDARIAEFRPIAAVTRRTIDGEIVEVRTKMGRRLRCTPDHPLVTRDGVKLAADLTTSDWLPLALGSGSRGAEQGAFNVLDGLAAATLRPADVVVRPAAAVLPRGAAPHLRPVLAVARSQDVVRAGALRLDECARLGLPLEGAGFKTARNGTLVPRRIANDAAFWRVVGLYIAEGHVGVDGNRRRIQWSFHPRDEDDLVETVRTFWSRRGVKATVRRLPTTTTVVVSSRLLAGFWLGSLGLGANAYQQRLPDAIWEASEEHKLALLAGLWRGDGSWSYVNRGPSVVLEYGTVSRDLADGVLRLLGALGFIGSVRVGRTAKSTCDTYWIRITGAAQVEQLLDLVPEVDRDQIRMSVARQKKRIAPTGYRRGPEPAAWVRATSTRRLPFRGPVYSVEVPGAHTFVTTGGLVVHNCFPKDVKALARIGEQYEYHPELLHAVMDINRDQRRVAVGKLRECLGTLRDQTIGLLGLAFKPETDDMREAPSIDIVEDLLKAGATVRAYDPAAAERSKDLLPGVELKRNAYAVARGADAVVLVTEWNEFKQLDLQRIKRSMRRPVFVDGRNVYDPKTMRDLGFVYRGIGRN